MKIKSFTLTIIMAIVLAVSISTPTYAGVGGESADTSDELTCVVVIEDITPSTGYVTYATSKTRTSSKMVYYQNSSGETMWYVGVVATFTYNGSTSKCTAASVSAGSNVSNWKVSNKKCSYSGNKATASATGKKYLLGIVTQTVNKSVALTCSKTGALS